MKVIKWLDEHFEEFILAIFLILISCVTLAQIVARNTPIIPTIPWAEELCRFLWIGTVFLSLPYTIRTETMLRVTALLDILPWKVHNVLNILVDVVTFAMMAVLSYYSVVVLQRIMESGETSPAMLLPMWIMYLIVLIGFVLAALRSVQMFIIHIQHINEKPLSSIEEQTEFELASGNFEMDESAMKADAVKASSGERGDA